MIKKAIILSLILFLMGTSGIISAIDKDFGQKEKKKNNIFPLREKIIVTATMTRKEVKDCSASVCVITEKDIKTFNVSNALNLLGFLPGIFIQKTGDFGRADVEMRGLGSRGRRISIMIDGRPEKMGLFGCVVTHSFPLDNVERIEVVRGPSSVLYGSDALGGVINILTKRINKGFQTDFTISYGTYQTQQYLFRHGGNINSVNYYFTLNKSLSDGHLPNSNYNGQDFTGRIGYSLSDNFELILQGKYFSGKKYEPGTESFPLVDYWNDYKRGAVDLTLSGKWQKSEAYFKIYRNFGHHQFSDGWHSKDYVNGGVVRYTTRAFVNNELTVGFDFKNYGGKRLSSPSGSWEKHEYGIFVNNEHVLFKKLILSTGVRFNNDSLYGIEFCPHVGAVYHLKKNSYFKININKGFRSPQLNELYMFPPSNPDLKPERVWDYEFGIGHDFGSWLSSDFVIYYMKGENLIEIAPNPVAPPKFKFFNTEKFIFKGAELSLRFRFNNNFISKFYYTYLDPGKHTRGRAKHKFDLVTVYNNKKLMTSFNLQYVANYYEGNNCENPLPNYFLVNTKIIYKLFNHFNIFLAVNNIFNENYKIFVDLPGLAAGAYKMPGRTFTIGTTVNF